MNYNSGTLLKGCLESLRNCVTVPFEVIVVDNQSSDDSLKNLPEFDGLKIIHAKSNLGFPRACNLGAQAAVGRVFHFLNPDTEVTNNINECYSLALGAKSPAIYVTRLLDTTNKSERSSHPIPTLKNIYNLIFYPELVNRWYLGASVLLSREVFESLGRWSTEYFMYSEDVDLFYKALLAGVPTVETSSIVVHHQGGSSRQVWTDRQRLEKIEQSALIFARKFGLTFDYFVFKHMAFCKVVWRKPGQSMIGLWVFWKEYLRTTFSSAESPKNTAVFKRP